MKDISVHHVATATLGPLLIHVLFLTPIQPELIVNDYKCILDIKLIIEQQRV